MKKAKKLFLIPLCVALLSGCSNVNIKYYQSNKDTSSSKPSQSNTEKIEDFFNDSQTTYTDNITSIGLETLYETCKKATVTIETYVTYVRQGVATVTSLYSSGSGFIAKESENYLYIYTNAHVTNVSKSSIISINTEVILSDYSRYNATIVASNANEDVSIIRIDKPNKNNFLVASLANSDEVKPGASVFAIGSPLGLDYASTLTSGIISGVNVANEVDNDEDGSKITMYLLQTDTAINPGNSGGPLFNYKGQVIGINTLKITQSESGTPVEGIGFAIPINHFNLVATTLLNGETYKRPQLGISATNIAAMSLDTKQKYKITIDHGLYISEVTNKNSNLEEHTIITHINNKNIYTFSDFASELYNYRSGDTVRITYCNIDGSNSKVVEVLLI